MKNKSSSEKRNNKKEEIILAAKKLFAKQGYHATSTRSINTAVGASDGLLYHYFPNGKKELLLAVVEYEINIRYDFFVTNIKVLPEDLPLKDFLYIAMGKAMENLARDADIFIIIMRESSEISTETTELIGKVFAELGAFLVERFELYIKLGAVKDLSVYGMVHQFVSAVQSYALLKASTNVFSERYSSQEYRDFAVGHMLKCWEKPR